MSYVLHYAPDNASLIVRIALNEMGLPYQTRLVDRAAQAQHSPAFRALNPAGTIPVLETPHGAIAETGAILLWLADRHRALAPASDAPERGVFLQRLFFLSNTVQALMRMRFYPARYVGDDAAAQAALSARLTTPDPVALTLPGAFAVMAGWAETRTTVDLLDPYIGCLCRWAALYPANGPRWFTLDRTPALAARLQMIETRPAARAAATAEGLGPTIFTAPRLPQPPEGSAT